MRLVKKPSSRKVSTEFVGSLIFDGRAILESFLVERDSALPFVFVKFQSIFARNGFSRILSFGRSRTDMKDE